MLHLLLVIIVKEFFEKRKMQQRLKNLGISLPASPGSSSGSLDLVTLFIVNQIAAKKENKGPPKVAVLGSSKGGSKHKRNEPLVLPMSPCSPSQLSLVESQPQYSVQGARKRKQVVSQGFKQHKLSPVLESAFSDNSASDYLPPITDGLSPFSTSSASSGQGGVVNNTEARDHVRHKAFSLNQLQNREPALDFTLNQSETEQQYEEDIFRGFSTDGCEREVCLEHNNGPMNGCDCSPSYSCQGGYLSSDSADDDESCLPCLQVSYMDQASCSDSLYPNLGLQVNPEQRHNQPRLLTPLVKPTMNFRDDQTLMLNVACPDKNLGSTCQQTGSNIAQTSEPCKCNKTCKDAETQTINDSTAEMCDASTQCSLVADSATAGSNLCLPPVDVSVQHPATGRQTDAAAYPNTHTPSSSQAKSGGKHTPWSETISRAGSPSDSSIINKFTAHNSGSKVIQQRPTNPFAEALSITDGRGKENRECKHERRQQENGRLIEDLSNEERVEVTSAIGVNRLSEKAETLEEIADILVLLKQRKTEGW
ncbi:hypothetical protein L3Q82_009517 [Scortum barcoo]|uniref:Uncharacterized protein n=1 Tax=Scortum barcoo TaxID=214431 RepID=A0ACB8WHX2_9TELE|nr:hypothetical protein L3Q82_009517 [Scortum barcoo]